MTKMILVVVMMLNTGCAALERMANTQYWIVSRNGEKLDGPYGDPIACYNKSQALYNAGYAVKVGCMSETRQ